MNNELFDYLFNLINDQRDSYEMVFYLLRTHSSFSYSSTNLGKKLYYHPELNMTKLMYPDPILRPLGFIRAVGRSWWHDPTTGECGLFFRGCEPKGWSKGRINLSA